MKDVIEKSTKRVIARFVCALLVALPVGSVAGDGSAMHFKQTWSGWGMQDPQADVDGNMTGIEGNFSGRGVFGRADNHAVVDFSFSGAPCETPSGEMNGLTIDYIAHSNILRTRNGDQLFREMASSPPSVLCFDPVAQSSVATVYLTVVGGTGRFKDATGTTVLTTRVQAVGRHNSIHGVERGTLYGLRRSKGDD